MAKYLEVMENEEQLKAPRNKKTEGTQIVPFKYSKGSHLKRDLSFPVRTQTEVKELE